MPAGNAWDAARDLELTLRGPRSQPPRPRSARGQGRSGGVEHGAGSGAARNRGAAPGEGLGAIPRS